MGASFSSSAKLRSRAPVEISLLGGLQVRVAGQPIVLTSRKAQAVLAYLAARLGRWHEREQLHVLFWPDVAKEQAQASLRQLLVAVRKALPASVHSALESRGNALALSASQVVVDVLDLEQRLSEGTHAALEQAAALYQGALLEGFTLGESTFDDWLGAERTRLSERMLIALEQLAALQADQELLAEAISTAQHALRLEPLRESAHRLLMQLYARQGNRARALQQYQACANVLSLELGLAPEAETQRVRFEILRPPVLIASTTQQHSERLHAAEPNAQEVLVGRDAEFAELEASFDASCADEARVVLLVGEAGIGKTRLLATLAERVCMRGGRCAVARSFESEHILPFALWADLLRAAASLDSEPPWSALDTPQRSELARLVPAALPTHEPPIAFEDTHVLFEAVVALLTRLAQDAPLLLVLEDLHWADAMSLRLLSFVARRVPKSARICLAASVRSEALASASTLLGVLHELRRERELCQIELTPLNRSDALTLLRAALPADLALLDAEMIERVWAISEGNPLAIHECARSLRDQTTATLRPLAIPERVREVIAEHLLRQERSAVRVLQLAAVIGKQCSFALLAASSELDERSVADALVSLVDARLLESAGDGFYFTHDRIREAVYQGLLCAEQRVLHACVARALESLHRGRLAEVAGFLAHHFGRAEISERKLTYLMLFARRCVQDYGLEEALHALSEAERTLPALAPEIHDVRQVELAIQRAACLCNLRRVPEMERCLAPLEATVERLALPRLSAPFNAWLALSYIFLGQTPAAEARATRALSEAERCEDHETAGYAHSLLSLAALNRAQFRRGVAHGEAALRLLDPLTNDPAITAFACLHLAGNHLCLGAFDAALEAINQADAIARRCDSARLATFVLATTASVRQGMGNLEGAVSACRDAVACAPDPYSNFFARLILVRICAFVSLQTGGRAVLDAAESVEAIAMLEASLSLTAALGMHGFNAVAQTALAETYLARGEAERARQSALASLRVLSEVDDAFTSACALRALGRSELALHNLAEATKNLQAACQRFEALGAAFELTFTRRLVDQLDAPAAFAPL